MKIKPIALAVAALTLAPAAFADSISGLKNTGAGLATDAQDMNYVLSVVSGSTTGLGSFGYVAQGGTFPIGPWVAQADTDASKWLTPTINQAQSFDPSTPGVYSWKLNFDLTGYNAATASFAANWAADNNAVVKLNGTQIGSIGTSTTSGGHSSWSSFAAASGFNAGTNTLEFLVTNLANNGGNPTGLRVQFTSSTVAPVPEPETYAMLLAGLGLMGGIARRRSQAK